MLRGFQDSMGFESSQGSPVFKGRPPKRAVQTPRAVQLRALLCTDSMGSYSLRGFMGCYVHALRIFWLSGLSGLQGLPPLRTVRALQLNGCTDSMGLSGLLRALWAHLAALNALGQFVELGSNLRESDVGVDGLESVQLLQLRVQVLVHDGHLLLESA